MLSMQARKKFKITKDPFSDDIASGDDVYLNDGFRFAVVLCDLLGFPYVEAAQILGVQEGTIKSRIFRAREALATALREAGYETAGSREATARNPEASDTVPTPGLIGEECDVER